MLELELRRRLERKAGKPVALTVTDNRSSMVSVVPSGTGMVKLRLHHMFLDAPPDVVAALSLFIRRPTPECHRILNAYIKGNAHRIGGRPRHRAAINLSHRGFHFDLRKVYDRLNERYFDGRLRAAITWGKSNGRNRRYSIDFGSYDERKRVIRINPSLDRPFVPGFFLDYIVYHEMLHAALGFREAANGRRDLHSPRFREEERQFRFYRSALRWESANLWRFLRAT
ncbi:MAG TPA: SprT-like domain-containing protein [Candidatus Polarisedimenticolia bacterium]|nr:SprT-like domain-containing protein [Candidatus Polarisedimenticolia bacterium]